MSIFFRFRTAKLLQAKLAEQFTKNIRHIPVRGKRHRRLDRCVILGHTDIVNLRLRAPFKTLKRIIHKGPRDLARPVATEVKEDHTVAVFNQCHRFSIGIRNVQRRHKFVRFIFSITGCNRLGGIGGLTTNTLC